MNRDDSVRYYEQPATESVSFTVQRNRASSRNVDQREIDDGGISLSHAKLGEHPTSQRPSEGEERSGNPSRNVAVIGR